MCRSSRAPDKPRFEYAHAGGRRAHHAGLTARDRTNDPTVSDCGAQARRAVHRARRVAALRQKNSCQITPLIQALVPLLP